MAKDIEATKKILMEKYSKHLDQFFAAETFEMSFDERENMIYGGMEEDMLAILERHLEDGPHGISGETPLKSISCSCGETATLVADDQGQPKIRDRKIMTRNGPVTVQEYQYYCASERKLFFPLPEGS